MMFKAISLLYFMLRSLGQHQILGFVFVITGSICACTYICSYMCACMCAGGESVGEPVKVSQLSYVQCCKTA